MPNTINQWVAYLSTDKAELHIKDMKSVVRGGPKKCKILELTRCSHVGLFVDGHPKFTCQTQYISGSHTWAPTNKSCASKVKISSERRQKKCKYWNLHAVVMSDCSLIATRNSHAKHNQSVGRIPRGAEVLETWLTFVCWHVTWF